MEVVRVRAGSFPRLTRVAGARLCSAAQRGGRAALVGLAIGVVASYQWSAWWCSPEHRIRQFVACGSRGDMGGMLALASPEEVRRLRLTPGKLGAMLHEASGSASGITMAGLQWESLPEGQAGYNRWARLAVCARDASPLIGSKGGPMTVILQAYKTDAGWKIGLSNFMVTLLAARAKPGTPKGTYAAMCARHDITPELFWPHNYQWQRVPRAPSPQSLGGGHAAPPLRALRQVPGARETVTGSAARLASLSTLTKGGGR